VCRKLTHTQCTHSTRKIKKSSKNILQRSKRCIVKKRGIKKPKEKLLKNNFQKLLAPSLSLPLSFFLLYPSSSVAGALY